jgi:hypothetical protein
MKSMLNLKSVKGIMIAKGLMEKDDTISWLDDYILINNSKDIYEVSKEGNTYKVDYIGLYEPQQY